MKTHDNYFRGFPALWNCAAFYLLLLRPAPWLTAIVIAVLAMFRGFLYRGWVRPGSVVTPILVLTLLWTGMHLQYDWFGMLQVFLTGLLLGWLRWLSGSTSLTILLHEPLRASVALA